MRAVYFFAFLLNSIFFASCVHADTEPLTLDERLYYSIVNGNIEDFKKHLVDGGNPSASIRGDYFVYSSMCEATRVGNELFLDAIINTVKEVDLSVTTITLSTPINCSIKYKNFAVFTKFVSMGVNIDAVINPEFSKKHHKTILDVAIAARNPEVMFYMLERTEPNDRQVSTLVRSLERFGGFEETDSVKSR